MTYHSLLRIAGVLTLLLLPTKEIDMTQARIPPARDGNVAIAEEFDAAQRSRSIAAYDLFIARHPGHALTDVARKERDQLAAEMKRAASKDEYPKKLP